MQPFNYVFHAGTFLSLVATVLLIVTSVSNPVTTGLSLMTIELADNSLILSRQLRAGVFGTCAIDQIVGSRGSAVFNNCSVLSVGYPIVEIVAQATSTAIYISSYTLSSVDSTTNALILIPISAGLCGIAVIVALLSAWTGYLISAVMTILALIFTTIAFAVSFSLFGSVKNAVNYNENGSTASFGNASWLLLAAFIIIFLASLTVCFAGGLENQPQTKSIRRQIASQEAVNDVEVDNDKLIGSRESDHVEDISGGDAHSAARVMTETVSPVVVSAEVPLTTATQVTN